MKTNNAFDTFSKYSNLEQLLSWFNQDLSNSSDIKYLLEKFITLHKELGNIKLIRDIIIEIDTALEEFKSEEELSTLFENLLMTIDISNPNSNATTQVPSLWLQDVKKRLEEAIN